MNQISKEEIVRICSIPIEEFDRNGPRVPYRIVKDSEEMGDLMGGEFVAIIEENDKNGAPTRAIVPCGPSAWYGPFTRKVNERKVSLKNLTVFHMALS